MWIVVAYLAGAWMFACLVAGREDLNADSTVQGFAITAIASTAWPAFVLAISLVWTWRILCLMKRS